MLPCDPCVSDDDTDAGLVVVDLVSLWSYGLHSSRGFMVSVAILVFSGLSDFVICVLVLLDFLLLLFFMIAVVVAVADVDVPSGCCRWSCLVVMNRLFSSPLILSLLSFDYCKRQCKKKLDTAMLADF